MKKNQPIKILSALFGCILLLSACAGPDRPYTMAKNQPATNTGANPGTSTPGQDLGPCTPKIKEMSVVLSAKGDSVIQSDPKEIPDMIVRFSNTGQVSMRRTDFQQASIILSGANIGVALTNDVTGTYTAEPPSLVLNDLVFQTSGFLSTMLPPITLTTQSVEQGGGHGSLTGQGYLNPTDNTIKLVGGARIPPGAIPAFPNLDDAALLLEFTGTLERIPDISTCNGGDSGSGAVQFKKLETVTQDGHPVEAERPVSGTFDFGRIFVPEQGVDTNTDLNEKFVQERRLRVKVPTGQPDVNATIASSAGFNITPNGNIHIASGGQQDFTIRFSMPAVPYTSSSPAESADATTELNFSGSKLTLSGKVKRAAPEMVMTSPTSTTIDLGNVVTPVRQETSSTRILCGNNRTFAQQKITLKNTGVRELQITRIEHPGPVDASQRAQQADPGCQNLGTNGTEFSPWGLRANNGAVCSPGPASGTLTGACRIPVGNGDVSFKVIYLPINASNITGAQSGHLVKDQAKLTIQSNDPKYTTGLTLNFSGSITPDQSNVIKIRRQDSSFEVGKGGVIKIASTNAGTDATQLLLVNKLSQDMQISDIRVPANSAFSVLNTPDKPKPTRVPASNGSTGEDGVASFWVQLTPPANAANRKVFNSSLDVVFSSSAGQQSTFTINLVGTFNLDPLGGITQDSYVEFTSDKVTSFIDKALGDLNQDTVDSLDYRIKGDNVKPGPLRFQFHTIDPMRPWLKSVKVIPNLGLNPLDNGRLAQQIKNLPLSERAKLFRVYTTRMSGLKDVGVHQDGDGDRDGRPDCTEPTGPLGDYREDSKNCSYFYYIIDNKPNLLGEYNDLNGALALRDLEMRFVNPYHESPSGSYDRSLQSVIDLKATLSTFDINSLTINASDILGPDFANLPLVTSPTIGGSEVYLPSDPNTFGRVLADDFQKCPTLPAEGGGRIPWSPADLRFEPQDRAHDNLEPKFLCNVSDTAPYFLKGFPVTPVQKENGEVEYKAVLTLLTRYGGQTDRLPDGYLQGIPPFLADARMWIALQGTLKQCGAGTTATGPCLPMASTGR